MTFHAATEPRRRSGLLAPPAGRAYRRGAAVLRLARRAGTPPPTTRSAAMTKRDSHGRFKADHRARTIAIGATAAIGAVAAGVAAAFHFGGLKAPGNAEHPAPDLALDAPPPGRDGRRAPEAFRPDPTAPVTAAEREGLRPATGPATGFAADRGSMRSETAPVDG